ncbi:MAG: RNase adapter RapZ [Nevskiales bacterium]
MKIVVVSGLSGSGKSVALGMLEDLGYYCIDNLPLALLTTFTADVLQGRAEEFPMLAVGIDARARSASIRLFPERIKELRAAKIDIQVLFFDADKEVILRRYNETRRKHPLTDAETPLVEAVEKERRLLEPIAACADVVIDTSRTNMHQLREQVRNHLQGGDAATLSLLFQSFGYKFGLPQGVDFVFDARCLPNPHWIPELKDLTGRDQAVIDYLEQLPETGRLLKDIAAFLKDWLPRFKAEDRSYVTVAIGCTGGRHRSVYLVERLAEQFRSRYPQALVRHTELP